jgi:hypothetical protein
LKDGIDAIGMGPRKFEFGVVEITIIIYGENIKRK